MTYNIPTFKANLKEAFVKAKSGEQVFITRHDETFRLVLDGTDYIPTWAEHNLHQRIKKAKSEKPVINKGASK